MEPERTRDGASGYCCWLVLLVSMSDMMFSSIMRAVDLDPMSAKIS